MSADTWSWYVRCVSKTKPRFLADDEAVIVVSGVRVMCEEVSLASCFGQPIMRNSVFDEFRASRFAAIQFETAAKVDLSDIVFIGTLGLGATV